MDDGMMAAYKYMRVRHFFVEKAFDKPLKKPPALLKNCL